MELETASAHAVRLKGVVAMIKGITVTLYNKTENGKDAFNKTIWVETPIEVENVLVSPVTNEAVIDELRLTGKKLAYQIAIPKGDTHEWRDRKVAFFGETFRTFGNVEQGIDENIPLMWNKKVKVERYG